jgi:hypothetical protein
MSAIDSLLERIRAAHAAIAEVENVAARHPGDVAVLANLGALKRSAAQLEESWEHECRTTQVEICRYRLFSGTDKVRYDLKDVASSLLIFQELFSSIYDALKNGPKKRARHSGDLVSETAFEFGFSYAGSLGVALMVDSESMLFGSRYDDTIETFLQATGIENEYDVRDMAKTLGDVVVKKVYDWSRVNFNAGYGVDVGWINSKGLRRGALTDRQRLAKIVSLIGRTSDVELRKFRIRGVLVGFDSKSGRFRFVEHDGPDYSGTLSINFPSLQEWTVNANYIAEIEASSVTHYATQETRNSYALERLEPDLST